MPRPTRVRGHVDDEEEPEIRIIDPTREEPATRRPRKAQRIDITIPSPEALGLASRKSKPTPSTSQRDSTAHELRNLGVVSIQLHPAEKGWVCTCRLRTERSGLKHIIETDVIASREEAFQVALNEARRWNRNNK